MLYKIYYHIIYNNLKRRRKMSKKDKVVNCKGCGAELSSGAKTCPSCGRKVKTPFYKRWWFWAAIAVIVIAAVAGGNGHPADSPSKGSDTPTESSSPVQSAEPAIEYAAYEVTELFDALKNNALKAEKSFNGQYVEITGHLGTVDSSGNYIGIGADENNYDYFLDEIKCNITSDEQLDKVMELNANDTITVRGKITSVGEVMGYVMDIDSIS